MKTPTKKKMSEPQTPPSMRDRGKIYKKFEVLVIALAPSEEIRGSPDVGVAVVGVPNAIHEVSRLAEHTNAGKIVELIQHAAGEGTGFDGVLVDSIFDTGVDIARELVEVPVVGLFWPSVSQAFLIGQNCAILHVYPGPARASDSEVLMLEALALRHGVRSKILGIECVAMCSLPAKDESELAAGLAEVVSSLARRSGAGAVVVSGLHQLEAVRLRVLNVAVVDASLSGLGGLESMLRQGLVCSRRQFPKSGHKIDL